MTSQATGEARDSLLWLGWRVRAAVQVVFAFAKTQTSQDCLRGLQPLRRATLNLWLVRQERANSSGSRLELGLRNGRIGVGAGQDGGMIELRVGMLLKHAVRVRVSVGSDRQRL